MKKSLELLGVKSSGLEDLPSVLGASKNDDEVFNEAIKINNLVERETYLRKFLEKKSSGYPKSKCLLAELIKMSDLKYACDLIFSLCRNFPSDSNGYLLFGEIAIEHNAWLVAKSALEVVIWICPDEDKDVIKKTKTLLELVLSKITSKEKDNSKNEFWYNKEIDKHWVLQMLYNQSKIKELIEYSFKLLDTFPDDKKNYEVVYKALSLTNNKEAFDRFIDHFKKYLSNDKVNQNLYLGMAYHSLLDFNASNRCFQEVLNIEKINPKALFYLALNHLMQNDLENFVAIYEKIIPPPEPSFTALYFIYIAVLNLKLDQTEFPDQKNISSEVSKMFHKLLIHGQKDLTDFLIKQFKELNYHIILPFLNLYLAEMFIKENQLDKAKELLEVVGDNEAHRLYAWIYRLEGKEDMAEKELVKYRKQWIPEKESGLHCQLVDLNLPDKIPNDTKKIFELVSDAYKQTKDLIQKIDLEYGLNTMTCVETTCQDCCKKTFPYMSYTEYLYLRNWLDTQSEELNKQVYERSIQIVNQYKKKYGKAPHFIPRRTAEMHKEYPSDFTFDCPNLGENKCSVYDARPFTCRAYGYTSQDGIKYKGCNYFFEQLKGATKLNPVRKVINMKSFFDFAKHIDEMLIGNNVLAPIPVWLAQSHEETVKIVAKICEEKFEKKAKLETEN